MDSNSIHALDRFVQAQSEAYDQALSEIRAGCKESHWMWFVFPQYQGLGVSAISRKYAITSVAEATAYLDHPLLGARLKECCEALLSIEGRSANDIFGSPDDIKLRSSATLFARVSHSASVFEKVLEKYFAGVTDEQTIQRIDTAPGD